jgi:hypothetical protein
MRPRKRSRAPPLASDQRKPVKRLASDNAGRPGDQHDAARRHPPRRPRALLLGRQFIGDLRLQWLVGTACVVDLERMGVGDDELCGPEHFERWERDTGIAIEPDDIVIIHTG